LPRIREAAPRYGFAYCHAAGVDLLIDTENMDVRPGVHFLFIGEKVRPEYVEGVPGFSDPAVFEGALVAPVADLVRMKLTSYRLRDQVHIQDLDEPGLITPEIESGLSPFSATGWPEFAPPRDPATRSTSRITRSVLPP
jgi:hypothetical protein